MTEARPSPAPETDPVDPAVAATPGQVLLGLLPSGSTVRRTVEIASFDGAPLVLRAARVKDRRVSVSPREGVAAAQHVVEVRVKADGKAGDVIDERVVVPLGAGGTVCFGVFGMIGGQAAAGAQPEGGQAR